VILLLAQRGLALPSLEIQADPVLFIVIAIAGLAFGEDAALTAWRDRESAQRVDG
jgi:hypothetical protein